MTDDLDSHDDDDKNFLQVLTIMKTNIWFATIFHQNVFG